MPFFKHVKGSARPSVLGGVILFFLMTAALLGPSLASDPMVQNLSAALSPPGEQGLLGTDSLGRDVLSRVLYGARVSLSVGFGVLIMTMAAGTFLGTLAGYAGGLADTVIMRIADIFMAFPPLIIAMIAMAFLEPGVVNLIAVLVVVRWPQFARLVRGQVLSVKGMPYVDAARIAGTGSFGIIVRHILPNCYAPVIAYGAMTMGTVIIDETALSFLGMGITPPLPSWGVMLGDAKNYISTAPWLIMVPGLAVLTTVLGCNLLGDGLGYLLDPKQRRFEGDVGGASKDSQS